MPIDKKESHAFKTNTKRGSQNRLEWYIELRHNMQKKGIPINPLKGDVSLQEELDGKLVIMTIVAKPNSQEDVAAIEDALEYFNASKGDRDDTLIYIKNILKRAALERREVKWIDPWLEAAADPEVDRHLLQGTPAVVKKNDSHYPSLAILDPSLPAKELGNIWTVLLPGPKVQAEVDDQQGDRESREDTAESWRQKKLSKKNPRGITLETEVLGRLAFEVCLAGTCLGEPGFHQKVLDVWHKEASKFDVDPNKYGLINDTQPQKVLKKIRSAIDHLERRFLESGKASPFRKAGSQSS